MCRDAEGPGCVARERLMKETLKSIVFVIVTVMVALILQAHAGKLAPEQLEAADTSPAVQLQVYN
jgi:hypothetical protein